MENILVTLLACIQTKFVDTEFLRSWAANLATSNSTQQYWLEDLSNGTSLDKAECIVIEEIERRGINLSTMLNSLAAGFTSIQHSKGTISFEEFEAEIIDIADTGYIHGLNIDFLQAEFNSSGISKRLQEKFADLEQKSEQAFRLLLGAKSLIDKESSR